MTSHQTFKNPVAFLYGWFDVLAKFGVLFSQKNAFRVILITLQINHTLLMNHFNVSMFIDITSTQGYQARDSLSIGAWVELFLFVHRALIASVGLMKDRLAIFTGRLARQVGVTPAQGVDRLVGVLFLHEQLLKGLSMASKSCQGNHQTVTFCALQLNLTIIQCSKRPVRKLIVASMS